MVNQKPLVEEFKPPPDLTEIDPFLLMDEGRIDELLEMLTKEPYRIEAESHYYVTPIMHALVTRKVDVFNWLIGKSVYRFRDAVLTAVLIGDTFNVELLLKIRAFDDDDEPPKSFPVCMTPLMLAAHCDNYEMIKLLLKLGHKLDLPHRPDCKCKACRTENDEHVVAVNRRRLYSYRAISSHAYLLQDCIQDPVIDCFLIARDLEKCQQHDEAYAEKYGEMAKHVKEVPLAFLNSCCNESEATLMLSQLEGSRLSDVTALPRVSVAMDTRQKEFITSRHCMEILKKQWMGGWNDWDRASWITKQFRLLSHTIFYPLTCMLYLLTNGKAAKSYNYPVARKHFSRVFVSRFPTICYRYDFLQLITYLLAFHSFLVSAIVVHNHGEPYLHRMHWDPLHPTLLFEVLFTIAAVLSSWRLFYFLQIIRRFGPLVISIGKCVKDILLFWVIFVVVLGSFAVGLNYLIEHYKYNIVVRDGKTIEQQFYMTRQVDMLNKTQTIRYYYCFDNLFIQSAMRYLYWAWYGYLDPERLEVIVGNSCPESLETKHVIIQNAAEFLSAVYYMILVISLLNLMISLMATTAGTVLVSSRFPTPARGQLI
ncbi:Transient-receptor-potential-like protein [Trichuris trichiura]|uniref:Transient-receptor-potential-like protein n=1 Tax=Trichuris trichiura TaxID=36087 RepID=A0A077Z9H6_TRITR|nr:Transient-receptor-potential-like protein [Trichuris trichiura]